MGADGGAPWFDERLVNDRPVTNDPGQDPRESPAATGSRAMTSDSDGAAYSCPPMIWSIVKVVPHSGHVLEQRPTIE
jgi:hypothetical protein